MIDNVERRFLSFFLAVLLIVSVLPSTALAANADTTVLDGKFTVKTDSSNGASTSGQTSATVNDDGSIKIMVTSVKNGCGGFSSVAYHTVVITNVTSEELLLSFNYGDLNNMGTLTIDGVNKTVAGNVSKKLAPNGTITIKLTSKTDDVNATSIVLRDFSLKDATLREVTVKSGTNGTVKVNGTAITADETVSTDYATGVSVTATAASGYEFIGWQDAAGNVLSALSNVTIKPESDVTVSAAFIPVNSTAHWLAGGKIYTDLTAACTAAQSGNKLVVLLNNGILSGEYTIPSDVTVLIPYDDLHSISGNDPVTEQIPTQEAALNYVATAKVHRKLTMAEGAKITVNGVLELGAKHYASHGGSGIGGTPVGGYGQIEMGNNSKIIVNGTLYAWGYVTGSGEVIAESGARIHEKFQVTDYHGGTNTGFVVAAEIFPFNQYYIQNVEVRETLKSGATLHVHAGIYGEGINESTMAFLGKGDGMFRLSSGSVTKYYDPGTDRLNLDINGTVSMNAITLELGGDRYDTSNFILPLNNNITINIEDGAHATVNQDIVLQPGTQINLKEGGTLIAASGKNVYIMDSDNWGNFSFGKPMQPLAYVASKGGKPVARSLSDAKVNIDGELILQGKMYNSEAGAQIVSEGETGVVIFEGAADSKNQTIPFSNAAGGWSSGKEEKTVVPAQLRNGDGTTVSTTGVKAGAKYHYCATCDKWVTTTATVSFVANNETDETMDAVKVHDGCTGKLPANTFTAPEGMKFAGWNTVEAPTEADPGVVYADEAPLTTTAEDGTVTNTFTADTTLYAQWETANIAVIAEGIDEEYYTVNGQVVTVTYDLACKVGYLVDGIYEAIVAEENEDGSYSFTAEDGITEVLLVVKGDVTGDGLLKNGDKNRLNAYLLEKTTLTDIAMFAADVTGDGVLKNGDKNRLNAYLLEKTTLNW